MRLLLTLNILLLSLLCSLPGRAQTPAYAPNSALSQGKWVKISVKEGLNTLTPTRLKEMGFADPAKVHVYGYGGYRLSETLPGTEADDLPRVPLHRASDGSISFFGTGLTDWVTTKDNIGFNHQVNFYSTQSVYFLSDREPYGADPQTLTTPMPSGAKEVNTFTHLQVHEQDLASITPSGADLFGEDFRATASRSFSFPLTDATGDEVKGRIMVAGKSTAESTFSLSCGGKTLGSVKLNGSSSDSYFTYNQGLFTAPLPSSPSIDLKITYKGGGSVSHARLDYIELAYTRALRLNQGELLFRHDASGQEILALDGASQGLVIWDVSDPARVSTVAYQLSGSTARFTPSSPGLHTYYAFQSGQAKALTPTTIGSIDNQDIHSMPVPHMVIIANKDLLQQAERLAQYHRQADAMTVHVLTDQQIFNEFSSGRPDATALRKCLKMFYQRGKAQPAGIQLENCLLMGKPTYDHRLLTEIPRTTKATRMLTWENWITPPTSSRTVSNSATTCSDNYMACLDHDTREFSLDASRMSIGIGRFPVKSASEAKIMVDKLLAYTSGKDAGHWRSQAMLIADDADYSAHYRQMQGLYSASQKTPRGSDILYERLYLDSYPIGTGGSSKSFPSARARMFKMLNEGVGLLAYIGHANPTSWSAEGLMTYTDIMEMSNRRWPVILHISCEFVRYDDDSQSGAETMWLHPQAGAIAFIAANRKIYVSSNEHTARAFGESFYSTDSQGRPLTLGEAYRRTINRAAEIGGNMHDRHCFTLMGDPAMRVPLPEMTLNIQSINDTPLPASGMQGAPVVQAGSRMKAQGFVSLPSGEPDTSFNGTLTATLFDAETVVETYGHPSEAGKEDGVKEIYNDHKNRLASATFPVKDGKWEISLPIPSEILDIYTPAQLSLYASTTDGKKEAAKVTTSFYVFGYDQTAPLDTVPPTIEYLALGNRTFQPDGIVGTSTTLLARVSDESGINISSAGIGKQMTAIIDGRHVYEDLADYFTPSLEDPTVGDLAYPLDGLAEGEHTLLLQVCDNAGNPAKASIPFRVGAGAAMADIELRADASPATTSVGIYITASQMPSEATLEVFDIAGRRLWHTTIDDPSTSMKVEWDLTDRAGIRVNRGIYLYRATLTTPDGTTRRKTRKIAVTAPQ